MIDDTSVKGNRIWKVEKNENSWGTPTLLDTLVTKGGEYASSVAENGNLYFTFGPHRSPDWNIHKSGRENNKYSSPTILNFNSTGYEDVHTKIAMCRRHYAACGLGAGYVEQFVR